MKIYTYDFTVDDGSWTHSSTKANISGGTLNITATGGWADRYPDADWYSGANDDFIIEMDFKQDATNTMTFFDIFLVDDIYPVEFVFNEVANTMNIWYEGVSKVSQAFTPDLNWRTAKIRRVGTTFYFSVDGGTELSWDYGTARAFEYLEILMYDNTGKFDNFKYSWMKEEAKKNFMLFYGSKGRGKE